MDDFHLSLARIGLSVLGDQGFVLGGGHAIELHGIGNRPSEDIDLFTLERGRPAKVASDLVTAYEDQHLAVNVTRHTADLVQMLISDDDDRTCKVDVGVLWRGRAPVVLDIGPVLHPDDAVASKMDALFNRWAPRDFLDIDAILMSGRYTRDELTTLALDCNPGFSCQMFKESLSYLERIPDREFVAYGVGDQQVADLRMRFAEWQRHLEGSDW